MNSVLRGLSMLALVAITSGCQVCRVTDHWNDRVDRIADCEKSLDHWYNPRWDLTREYRPDGGNR